MARKTGRKKAAAGKGRTSRLRRVKPVRQRSSTGKTRERRAAEAVEEIRRGPLQPEIPVDPDAPLAALDPDALEVLKDTQEV